MRWVGAVLLVVALAGCSNVGDARQAELASTYARADLSLIRTRPVLVEGKYARMGSALYQYYRGTMPLALHDWRDVSRGVSASDFALGRPLVVGIGDPHPENFGILLAGDGSLALEPNDLDSGDRVPYLWDLRRLAVGMVIGAEVSNPDDPGQHQACVDAERSIARTVASSYATAMHQLADGAAPKRVDAAGKSVILADLFSRAERDLKARAELGTLTKLDGNTRRLIRGAIDPTDPQNTLADLPGFVLDALPAAMATYRDSLLHPPPPAYFKLLDAAREFGSGVASWPRVRMLILVQGPTADPGDDVVLELKEEADSMLAGWTPPGVYFNSVQDRVRWITRHAWARPDAEPLWGVTALLGFPAQIKRESDAQKTVRTKRFVKERGTPQALTDLAGVLGALLARVHATPTEDAPTPARDVWKVISKDPTRFADEQADAAVAYAQQVEGDFTRFNRALDDLGMLLGVKPDATDAPSADLQAVYGTPPEPRR